MPDMLRDGLAWLREQKKAHASQAVTYARPGIGSVEISAELDRPTLEVDGDDGVRTQVELVDFKITAAELVIDSELVLPQVGDRVSWEDGSQVKTYEVLAPGPGVPCYVFSDAYRDALRIHTKHIATDPGA